MARRVTALRTTSTALLLVSTLALAACGGDDAATDASTDGPLTEFFADVYGDWDEETAQAEQMEIEEAMARCMVEQGFEYQPVDQSAMSYTTSTDEQDPEKYAAEYGYGFSVYQEPSEEEQAAMDAWVDPNQEYVEAMSESEQTAYYEALYGEQAFMEYDEDAEMPEYDPATAGCQGAAELEVRGDQNALYESAEMVSFNEATTQLYEDIAADPRLKEADTAWSACMADAGFAGYTTPQEAMDDMMERSNGLWEGTDPEGPSEETIQEAQDLERDTAVADLACKEEVGYEKVQLDVQRELEGAFVEEHRAEMEVVRDLLTEAQK
ncbi:hypothetical protein [Cellulosimicrobium protaetiae]|uniref:Uncharacterized protein n=1 Tax=Cellulosimicrobium protaetiae TaxID=2587808 RepID=A0A6M5UFS0_9MICO|nr:hypothetical protein [Cellulosimicrobium protaetiae]QJW37457.1 hypothetical protein FIC82_015995 [Cellulosimicrobium protaetiae]